MEVVVREVEGPFGGADEVGDVACDVQRPLTTVGQRSYSSTRGILMEASAFRVCPVVTPRVLCDDSSDGQGSDRASSCRSLCGRPRARDGGGVRALSTDPASRIVVTLAIAVGFVAAGLLAWAARPSNGLGRLMTVLGFCLLLRKFQFGEPDDWLFTIGFLVRDLPWVVFGHIVLAYPTGQAPAAAGSVPSPSPPTRSPLRFRSRLSSSTSLTRTTT